MTTVIAATRRRGPFVALLAAVGLALGACATGPSQVNAAAVVGDRTISVDRVQDLVQQAVKAEPAARVLADQRKLDLLSREALRQLVQHELIERYAAKANLTVDPAKVAEVAGQIGDSFQELPVDGGVSPQVISRQAVTKVLDRNQVARDFLLLGEIGDRELTKLSVTFDFVLVTAVSQDQSQGAVREAAVAKANKLAEGLKQADAFIDAEIAAGEQAAKAETLTPAAASDIAGTVLFGAPENSVVAFRPNPENANWVVALIRKRDTNAKPDEKAKADPQTAQSLGPRLLQPLLAEVGVKISPRYGVWDETGMDIAPSAAEASGVVIPVKNAPAQ
ncbi:SurA N-terminal domain-containing protein [Actinokineospora auranticolor]|uniref:SurA-like protein n=1 Tax=Actinokineospora auranticolor TaxID=155976 RepID=A0A2S6GYL9_9PSEU|nr:SurA N-terminal domain-containing protein [Actinokineospora auranticolor]PPK70329.1 SurA-like protein [Actinokineospora auranticolor]